MVDVSGANSVQNTNLNGVNNDFEPVPTRAGAGATAQRGPAPAVATPLVTSAVLQSLTRLIPSFSGEQLDVLLAEATSKLKDVLGDVQTEKLLTNEEAKKATTEKKSKKLEESEEKRLEAKSARENGSIWEKVALAFQVLGAAIALAVGTILIATGAGVGPGIALVAVGLVSLTLAVDSIVKMTSDKGLGILGNVTYAAAKADGLTEEEAMASAQKGDMAFGITIGLVAIAISIGAFFIPGAQLASVAAISQAVTTIATAATSISSAAASIGSGVSNYQASKASADAKIIQADSKDLEAALIILDEFIDQLIAQISEGLHRINTILEDISTSINDRGKTLSRAQFSA